MTAKAEHTNIDICANCIDSVEGLSDSFIRCDNEKTDHYQHVVAFTHYACIFFNRVDRKKKDEQ